MFNHNLRLAGRNLLRNRSAAFINIGGLALGLAAFLLILEYVTFERSFNTFHKNLPNIYRLINESAEGKTWPETEPGWVYKASETLPEIRDYCRYAEGIAQGIVRMEGENGQSYREANISYADGNFFKLFSFPISSGDPSQLAQPNTVFLSDHTAEKYFGKNIATGKTISLYNQFGKADYTIAGVYTVPENSDIQTDMVFSLETLKNPANLNNNSWARLDNLGSQYVNTFFLVKDRATVPALEKKLNALREKFAEEKDGTIFHLQSLANLHLPASFSDKYPTLGNLKYVYILGAVSLLILLIAWFNYVNLSTAQAIKRAHEVGVRKVIGASRGQLIKQFLVESIVTTVLAFALALILVSLLQPFFNQVIGHSLTLITITNGTLWIWGLSGVIIGSLGAGLYTAWSLSHFNPVQTLKGKLLKSNRGALLRKGFVIAQFSISIALILVTTFIYQQLNYMQTRNLGLNPDQVVVVRAPEVGKDSSYKSRKATFLNLLASQSYVESYAQTGTVPGNYYNFATSGFTQPNSLKGDELKSYSFAIIDDRYLNTYQIPLKAGRNFTAAECAVDWDDNSKVMMNERAIEQLGFKSADQALQTRIQWDERQLQIVGIVKDYHHTGLQHSIDPIIFYPQSGGNYFSVRLKAGSIATSLSSLEKLYKEYFTGNPFEYFFEDENFNKQYKAEQQYGKIFTTAAVWAILIACLGLFGLTSFSMQARVKEIGIRKVLGASVSGIITLLSKDFLKLVGIAILVASPLAWWAINSWLQDFAYRVNISWWVFIGVGIISALIALITISAQTIKAAMANPVKSIQSE